VGDVKVKGAWISLIERIKAQKVLRICLSLAVVFLDAFDESPGVESG
jgi:hypothetical protein